MFDCLLFILSALHDRSPVIRKLHAQTIGYLATVASDETVEKLLGKIKIWYLEKEGMHRM